ncbi:hypothetical protein LTR85_007636 [Meristemomyces frigidus]|nr:hypothetical protein LTR85_007636 [Meristemomyces frigidus]
MSKRAASSNHAMTPSKIRRLETEAPSLMSKQLTIVVGVGDDEKTFYIHQNIVKDHSDFFAAALNKGWKEAEDGIVRLPTEVLAHFELFARFVYFGKIYAAKAKADSEDDEAHATRVGVEAHVLFDCWIMGDRLMAVSFKDAVHDAITQLIRDERLIPVDFQNSVYPKTAGPNSLRRLLVDVAVWGWAKDILPACEMDASWMEFFRDVAVRGQEANKAQHTMTAPFMKHGCVYHEHVAAGKPCYTGLFP